MPPLPQQPFELLSMTKIVPSRLGGNARQGRYSELVERMKD